MPVPVIQPSGEAVNAEGLWEGTKGFFNYLVSPELQAEMQLLRIVFIVILFSIHYVHVNCFYILVYFSYQLYKQFFFRNQASFI